MIDRWRRAPAWLLGVVAGTTFGLFMAVFTAAQHTSWVVALPSAGVGGAIFGVVMGPYPSRLRARERRAAGGDERTYTAAAAGLRRRSATLQDPAARQVAAAVARHRLDAVEHQRVWATVLFTVLAVVSAVLAVTGSPWHWLEVACFCAIPLASWQQRRRLRQQVADLSAGDLT